MGNTCSNFITYDKSPDLTLSFQAYIQEKNKRVPQIAHINLLSYNIFIRPPMISNNGDDYKDERLAEFTKEFKNYDIICLQEMFCSYSTRRTKLIEKAKEAGLLFSAESPKVETFSYHIIDGGLLILSRYPIVASEFCPYSLGLGADYYVNKGALYVKIKIGNSYLHLYTTHAQATYDHKNPKYLLKRAEQFICFQKFVKESLLRQRYCEDDLVLLTGDFNVDSRSKTTYQSQVLLADSVLQGYNSLAMTSLFTEYEALISYLSDDHKDGLEDLIYKKYNEHPITFGDFYLNDKNERKPKEKILTQNACLCADESLDYIFRYVPKGLPMISGSPKPIVKEKLMVKEDETSVDRFFVNGHDFDQLSDHYGVKVTLEYVQPNECDKEEAETVSGSAYEYESL